MLKWVQETWEARFTQAKLFGTSLFQFSSAITPVHSATITLIFWWLIFLHSIFAPLPNFLTLPLLDSSMPSPSGWQCYYRSVIKSCPTLCDPMNCSMPGFPVFHCLPYFAQTHVHWVGDTIQPSHLLLPTSPPALYLSQDQSLSQWVNSLLLSSLITAWKQLMFVRSGIQDKENMIYSIELWCWRRLLRVPWTARRTNQSILKEINAEYSPEGLMLKLQYFGHLMWRSDSL